jgi:ubiquinol-cytochrome c reductase cytochrome c subunit
MTRSRAEARLLARLLRIGLLLAVLGQLAWSFRPLPSSALTDQEALGKDLFETSCTTCHGSDASGTSDAPGLRGVGAAALDFYLSTGRMPLADPNAQPLRHAPAFPPEQIAAIVAYVRSLGPGGPDIPEVDAAAGDLPRGGQLFLQNCAACHGAAAVGDSIGGGQIAPPLGDATDVQIAEAIRVGPGAMPAFGERNLTAADVDAVARYLTWIRSNGGDGGAQLGRVGAVAEGLIALVIGLGSLVIVIRLTGSKT